MSKRIAVGQKSEPGRRFDDLFSSHYSAIHRYCARRLGVADAEDATADVFAVAWRRLDEMPPGAASKAWLFGVAYHVVGNQYRSRRRRANLTARLSHSGAAAVSNSGVDNESDPDLHLLAHALNVLSPRDGEILKLSVWDGLTRTEIASVLGIKENAVDQRLHRARHRLAERIDELRSTTPHINPKEASA